ncbi:uncharacterized protein LOC120104515 [Phoenix dactylifera]|uniref:Uncharacterized protein LOC120104515 n=1 Tax=Phoenix dactylifera TaxID=42345 RepID=A0A8B8ZJ23_PHODC|nr:uncharacterized protein LOC120104515 [Phoenix dactylifera]
MGNEMGNSNATGLQATEQDSTEAMNESSNSLAMSNSVDGLKGETDGLADGKQATEQHDSEDATAGKTPKALIMSNNVDEDSKSEKESNFSVEFDNLHESMRRWLLMTHQQQMMI